MSSEPRDLKLAYTLFCDDVRLEAGNRELMALNQELESFSYSVSHDLRSPLRSMDGFSLALLEDYGDQLDEEARDSLQRIRGASQRMGRLIDELLGLARVTRAELRIQDVDLSAMAAEMAAGLAKAQPEREVRWEIDPGIVVRGDRELLAMPRLEPGTRGWETRW